MGYRPCLCWLPVRARYWVSR